jgi:hypothetical protein
VAVAAGPAAAPLSNWCDQNNYQYKSVVQQGCSSSSQREPSYLKVLTQSQFWRVRLAIWPSTDIFAKLLGGLYDLAKARYEPRLIPHCHLGLLASPTALLRRSIEGTCTGRWCPSPSVLRVGKVLICMRPVYSFAQASFAFSGMYTRCNSLDTLGSQCPFGVGFEQTKKASRSSTQEQIIRSLVILPFKMRTSLR